MVVVEEPRREEEMESSGRENGITEGVRVAREVKGASVSNRKRLHGSNVDRPCWYGSKLLILGLAARGQEG